MAQLTVPPKHDPIANLGKHLRAFAEESNDQDNRLAAIENAIAALDKAIAHYARTAGANDNG